MTDKLTTLTATVARLLDGAMALPTNADRDAAADNLSFELRHALDMFDSQKHADDFDRALSALDIPDDVATKVIDREVSFEADNDCGDACKI